MENQEIVSPVSEQAGLVAEVGSGVRPRRAGILLASIAGLAIGCAGVACGQPAKNKPASKVSPPSCVSATPQPVEVKEQPDRPVAEGAECRVDEFGFQLQFGEHRFRRDDAHDERGFFWTHPAGEIWECRVEVLGFDHERIPTNDYYLATVGKWRRDIKLERHKAAVRLVAEAVSRRKLTADEIWLVREATMMRAWEDAGSGCLATQNADLVAQLSFWRFTEAELPIALMIEYSKGQGCNEAGKRAYQIMNDRIVGWLEKQAQGGAK